MATVKVKFRASRVEGKKGVVYYQVIHDKVIRQIRTEYLIYPHEWDALGGSIKIDKKDTERANELKIMQDVIRLELRNLYSLSATFERQGRTVSCEEFILEYYKLPKVQTFFGYFKSQIDRLNELNRTGTAHNYLAALNSFSKFRKGVNLIFDDFTVDVAEEYEAYLRKESISMNSISFYMRILRAVYNKAVDKGLAKQQYPFKRVYTGVEKTLKRALTIDDIKRIKQCDLNCTPWREYARDMFLFSFYTRGMSFIDMAYLRKSSVKNGVLTYRRRKTGQLLHIKWESCMQEIVDRYSIASSLYLLPIIHGIAGSPNEHNRYKNELCKVNNSLKKISEEIKLCSTLTMYVARHSWASAARSKNIPISVISEGMGHDSETTTQIYLASLDTSIIDKANSLILRGL